MTGSGRGAQLDEQHVSGSRTTLYRTPRDAMAASEEKLAYVALPDPRRHRRRRRQPHL